MEAGSKEAEAYFRAGADARFALLKAIEGPGYSMKKSCLIPKCGRRLETHKHSLATTMR